MMDIKIFLKWGYYIILKTLYIRNMIVVYVIYFTYSLYYYVLICSSLLLKNYNFSLRNLSSPTVFISKVAPLSKVLQRRKQVTNGTNAK